MSAIIYRLWQDGDDLVQMTEVLHRAYRELAELGLLYVATSQPPEVTAERMAGLETHIALDQGRIIGTITYSSPSLTNGCAYYEQPGVAAFHMFAVDPAYRGQYIGTELLARIEQRAIEDGATELALDTSERAHRLIGMYEKMGYAKVSSVQWDGVNYRSVVMSKPLPSRQSS